MKSRNSLWLLSAPVSVLYLGEAALAFYKFHRLVQMLKYYGISEEEQLRLDNVVRMRNGLTLAGSIFLLFSLASVVISYGLFHSRIWAKYSWYVISACFMIFHLYWLVDGIGGNKMELIERGFEFALSVGIVMGTPLITFLGIERQIDLPPPPPEEFAPQGPDDT